jgi:hypothetical protein
MAEMLAAEEFEARQYASMYTRSAASVNAALDASAQFVVSYLSAAVITTIV